MKNKKIVAKIIIVLLLLISVVASVIVLRKHDRYQTILTTLVIWKNKLVLEDRAPLEDPLHEFSIVVSSCDKYSELWDPFFTQLFRFWPGLKNDKKFIPIFLISNFKKYNNKRVINVMVGEDKSWSDNMLKALKLVKTRYVIVLLDDYILRDAVNEKRLLDIINLMYKTRGVYSSLNVSPNLLRLDESRNYVSGIKGVLVRNINVPYRNNLQACIWDVAEFKKSLKPGESAWDYERAGNSRSKKIPFPFYMLAEDPVFKYYNLVAAGKYIKKSSVDAINSQGANFHPKNIKVYQYLLTDPTWQKSDQH